jgi:hypothetical protein
VFLYYANWGSQTVGFRFNGQTRQRSLPVRMQAAGLLADDDRDQSVKFAIKQNRWNESHGADTFFDFDLLDA